MNYIDSVFVGMRNFMTMESNVASFVAIVTGILIIIIFLTSTKRLKGIPGPMPYPIIGNSLSLILVGDLSALIKTWTKQYGKCFQFVLLGHSVVVFSGPEQIRSVLNSKKFNVRWEFTDEALEKIDMKHSGLVNNNNVARWKLHKQLFTSVIKGSAFMREVARVSCSNADKLIQEHLLSPHQPVNVSMLFKLFTLDTIGQLSFGRDFGALEEGENHAYTLAVVKVLEALTFFQLNPPFVWKYLHQKKAKEHVENIKNLRRIEMEILKEARQKLKERKAAGEDDEISDFPTLLIMEQQKAENQSETKESSDFSDEHLCEDMREMILGGTDTSSNSLSYVCYHIAKYPDKAAKLRKEIESTVPHSVDDPEFMSSLSKLVYTDAFIKEVDRMQTIVPLYQRGSTEDHMVGKYFIPKGTGVIIHKANMAMDPNIVKDPETFEPERWLDPVSKVALSKATYMFGHGERRCPGEQVARVEIKCALARILSRTEIELERPGQVIKTKYDIVSHPVDGKLFLRFSPRKTK